MNKGWDYDSRKREEKSWRKEEEKKEEEEEEEKKVMLNEGLLRHLVISACTFIFPPYLPPEAEASPEVLKYLLYLDLHRKLQLTD